MDFYGIWWVTDTDAAQLLGWELVDVELLALSGQLPYVYVRGHLLFPSDELDALVGT